jgi:DNA topoisomerase-1
VPNGKGFLYRNSDGALIRSPGEIKRIKKIAIPPAWKNVWICENPNGHLQATGRDSKGRKQYKYHTLWREVRDSTKFHRMIAFGEAIPHIRNQVDQDLARRGLPKEKILATIVRLLETTLIRVGNEEYARNNNSYGLTTLRNHHVNLNGNKIRFRFKGKSGKVHEIGIKNRRLARILKKCQEIPGQELFQYVDENGEPVSIDSADVNDYLEKITGQDFTAKDFRTWAGTILAFIAFRNLPPGQSQSEIKTQVKATIDAVAKLLGNTPAICKKSYIHPELVDSFCNGSLARLDEKSAEKISGLAMEESLILCYLRNLSAKS